MKFRELLEEKKESKTFYIDYEGKRYTRKSTRRKYTHALRRINYYGNVVFSFFTSKAAAEKEIKQTKKHWPDKDHSELKIFPAKELKK